MNGFSLDFTDRLSYGAYDEITAKRLIASFRESTKLSPQRTGLAARFPLQLKPRRGSL
jgi:hypothetical protein